MGDNPKTQKRLQISNWKTYSPKSAITSFLIETHQKLGLFGYDFPKTVIFFLLKNKENIKNIFCLHWIFVLKNMENTENTKDLFVFCS